MTGESQPPKRTFLQLDAGKRARVLEAAMTEFADCGFERANLDRIADAASIAKGSLYQYFHDKRACFDATAAHAFGVAFAEFRSHLRRSRPRGCFEEFRAALLFPLTLAKRHPRVARLYFRVGFLEAGALQAEIASRNSLFQEDWFERGIAAGDLAPDIDRRQAGFLLDAVATRVHFFALSGIVSEAALRGLARSQTEFIRRALGAGKSEA